MAAKIVIRHVANSSLAGRAHEFESDLVRLGRRDGNDVVFDPRQDTLVSGSHAELRVSGGRVYVNDSGSTNGTYVNGQRVTGPVAVGGHDRVTLGMGGPEMRIELAGAAAYAAPAPPAFAPPAAVGYQPTPAYQPAPAYQPGNYAPAPAAAFAPPAFAPPAPAGYAPAPAVPGFEMPQARPGPAVADRPVSRMAQQGVPNRQIGMNTLMGVLQKSRKDERRRIFFIAAPVVVVLVGVTAFLFIRAQTTPTPAAVAVNAPTTGPVTIIHTSATGPATVTWQDVYKRVEPSVYMIQAYNVINGQKVFYSSGTGWSVKKGLIATNAHVSALFDKVQPGGFVIARRGKSENDLRITRARPHPGYAQASRMSLDYRPFSPEQMKFAEGLQACDVALLEVDPGDWEKQGPPLPLADAGAVRSGTKVAYVGFPTEGSVATNNAEPSPYANDAAVTRLLGLMMEDSQPGKETFVGHSLNTLGGSSGSPIFNLDGQVVAVNFAGDVIGMTEQGRIGLAGFNYGVPVDMLKELLDADTLADKQEVRRKQWEAVLDKAFRAGAAKPDMLALALASEAKNAIAAKRGLKPNAVVLQRVSFEAKAVRGNATAQLRCPIPGEYIVVTVGDQPGDKLTVDLALGGETAMVNDQTVGGKTRRVYWGHATATIATAGTTLELKMASDVQTNVSYGLYVVRAKE